MLKLKARIYRYTGLYLANSDQQDYCESKEFWKDFAEFKREPGCDMSDRDIYSLMIGMWHSKHGFYRPLVMWRFKHNTLLWKAAASIAESFLSIYFDIKG